MNNENSPLMSKPDYLVCTCMGVMYSEICQEIQNGEDTFQKLSNKLLVGTGCNSCIPEVESILKDELKK